MVERAVLHDLAHQTMTILLILPKTQCINIESGCILFSFTHLIYRNKAMMYFEMETQAGVTLLAHGGTKPWTTTNESLLKRAANF